MRLRNYDPLQLPNDPEWKYFWAATNISSPQCVGAMKAAGYQTVPASDAKKLGYDASDIADGGMVDKTNNRIGTPDLVLMKINRQRFEESVREKNAGILRVVGKKTDEFNETAEKAGILVTD